MLAAAAALAMTRLRMPWIRRTRLNRQDAEGDGVQPPQLFSLARRASRGGIDMDQPRPRHAYPAFKIFRIVPEIA